jgi:hypothetical protein
MDLGRLVGDLLSFVGALVGDSSLRLGPLPTLALLAVLLVLLSLVARPSTRWMVRDLGHLAAVGRAMALAAGGALLFVGTVTLTKVVGHELRGDAAAVLTSWKLYALAPAGIGAMLLVQSAFMAGPIQASLPVLTCVECLGAIAVGALFLDEAISISAAGVVVEVLGLAVVVWGVITVARSPVLVATLEQPTEPTAPG